CCSVGALKSWGSISLRPQTGTGHLWIMSIAPSVYSLLMFGSASLFTWWALKRGTR
ncbi:MAG: Na+-dependent transporter, partial [Alishewanella sp. 32-51-5]